MSGGRDSLGGERSCRWQCRRRWQQLCGAARRGLRKVLLIDTTCHRTGNAPSFFAQPEDVFYVSGVVGVSLVSAGDSRLAIPPANSPPPHPTTVPDEPAVVMPATSVIDAEALLAPIPGDSPAGDARAYVRSLREQFEALRQEERPEDFDDATRPAVLKKPDWPKLKQVAQDALRDTAKDVRVACHLLEALAKCDGFAGVCDGLVLLQRLLDECWDRLIPEIEDGDLDSRAAPLANMLDDPDRGLRFPTSVRFIPLLGSQRDGAGLIECNRLRQSTDQDELKAFDDLVAATSVDLLAARAQAAEGSLAQLKSLVEVMDRRLGSDAPSLINLGTALTECLQVLREELSRRQPPQDTTAEDDAAASDAAEAGTTADGSPTGNRSAASAPEGQINSRAQAYAQLKQAADLLQRLEPHSPIPYLVRRAVELGRLPFPALMQQLIRDTNILTELNRELGIEESAAS